jgi:cation diffusion facilitator family transporter
VSVAVNTTLSALQVAVGLVSGSSGLIADGIHSLSDLVADFLVLFVSAHSRSEADERHPYGHHRFENAASLALGLLLAGVGIGMLWNAAAKIEHHEAIPRWKSPRFMWPAPRWWPRNCCFAICWRWPSAPDRAC